MAVYAVGQITIHDRVAYERYVAQFMPVLGKYRGRLLAADEQAEAVEGARSFDKCILLEFADRDEFSAWYYSPEYQEIAEDRRAGTVGNIFLINGLSRKA